MAGKDGHDSDDFVAQQQRVAGKRYHALTLCPFLIPDEWIDLDVVRYISLACGSDSPDVEIAHRNPAVRTVEVRTYSSAGVKLEHILCLLHEPYTGGGRISVTNDGFGTLLENR